jgi:hypothetical protein
MLHPAMNDTKWDEIRTEMYSIRPPPAWRTLSTEGYQSRIDREWYYHFREGGYDCILHLDIIVDGLDQRELVRSSLKKIHVPGEETSDGFRVFGYLRDGQAVDFL